MQKNEKKTLFNVTEKRVSSSFTRMDTLLTEAFEEITKLADLESREVLLAKLAGAMKASLNQAAYLFAAPLSQAARTIDALRAKVETEGGESA